MCDTFYQFKPPERGRFGDNENADARASVAADYVELALYRHRESASGLAVLLSPNGARSHAQWIPKSLVEEPATTEWVHPVRGDRCQYGRFRIARFKARELAWDRLADENQMGLL